VLFIAHNFSERFRFYSELEVEHALVGGGKPGEVGLEQAFVDWKLGGEEFGIRGGIVLVPMGIINQWHEPPIFHGVERPMVDKVLIPTTWREAAIGIFGEPVEGLRYEAYLMSGLDASSFSAGSGIRGGRQAIAQAQTNGFAGAARVEYEPTLGVLVGGSLYYGHAGPNADLYDAQGDALELDVPVFGATADARGRWRGVEARAMYAVFNIGETEELRMAYDDQGNVVGPDVGRSLMGGYAEVAYDVLHTLGSTQQLLPFVRFEYYDTLAGIEGRQRVDADDNRQVTDLVVGLSYRPVPAVVGKLDFIQRTPGGDADAVQILNAGIGFMF
jgi:hypothetical protein